MSDSDSDDDFLLLLLAKRRRLLAKRRRNRRFYVRPLNDSRLIRGEYNLLCSDVRSLDEESHTFLFRMNKQRFDDLLRRVGPLITKKKNHRLPISAEQRLAVCLRYAIANI